MPDHRFWTRDPTCFVASFRAHMPSASIVEMHAAVRAHESGVARTCVGYVHPGMVASRRALKEIAAMIGDPTLAMKAWVCCIGGTGFWAATGRGMATSVIHMKRPTAPVKLTGTMEEAVAWLEGLGLPTPSEQVRSEVLAFGP